MIAVLQRVSRGSVEVGGKITGKTGTGLVILLGVVEDDEISDAEFLAEKISKLRIFNDENDKMNLGIRDVSGSALVISQFTLCGDWRKGNRPSFTQAAAPEKGKALYDKFIDLLERTGIPVESGVFGARMNVNIVNEGPVTFVLDSRKQV